MINKQIKLLNLNGKNQNKIKYIPDIKKTVL